MPPSNPRSRSTDARVLGAALHYIPIQNRVPLKFGKETLTQVTCARARIRICDKAGHHAEGWGETPLSVTWVWPSATVSYSGRLEALQTLCGNIARRWPAFDASGTSLELGHAFLKSELPRLLAEANMSRPLEAQIPWLAALVCASVFDQALHDAYGNLLNRPAYATYGPDLASQDLGAFLESASPTVSFSNRFLTDFIAQTPKQRLPAWHLVGGVDPLTECDLTGLEPHDGYPVLLADWIRRDGLRCLKIKLRGNDRDWDYERVVRVGRIALENEVTWLTADFNCTVDEPEYVNQILDQLRDDFPRLYGMILYVEQPFPYDLESHRMDVRSVSARKPLFLDESAHDWQHIRLGRELGWTGVALKTCKTQTGALLSAAWAKAHGMTLMVQDLTNPMLAQIPHLLLAAHVGTIMGVETNSMQFYPLASEPEALVHTGLYRREKGCVDLSTLGPVGFGYRVPEIGRCLPNPTVVSGDLG